MENKKKIKLIKELLEDLKDEERLKIFNNFCKSCGTNLPCHCWNDE